MRYYDSFIACDIETTGFNIKKGSRIIEIGAVKVISESAHSVFSTLVGPKRYISKEISELTNISAEMLEGKPEIGEVLRNFLDFAGDSTITRALSLFFFVFFVSFADCLTIILYLLVPIPFYLFYYALKLKRCQAHQQIFCRKFCN